MKKFVFTLHKMRDYKKQMLEKEKNTLLSLTSEKNSLEMRVEELEGDIADINNKLSNTISGGTTIMKLQMLQFTKDSVKNEQKQVEKQIEFINSYIERQRKFVIALSQEVSGLDKLEQQQLIEYNKQVEKENELIIEEFVSFKTMAEKSESMST